MKGIYFTDRAIVRLKELSKFKKEVLVLRIRVTSGGCAGFQYLFSLESLDHSAQNSEDIYVNQDGVCAITDTLSLKYIQGSTIDYEETLMMSQFVISNPNSEAHCSCGSSFQIKS
ncbi:iron-sulfur cluster insertion protein ErpA [Holospora obtusa F1]|uniref:Iron-sulfur cluster insertion protein ErpA n=1 Tax=Holospora obtusa F1 TaxID=1399147 RepID=W6TSY2_HOLOB|nr:iron-sulfur cluster assembly accessory protein [Holospora obtusa]ETZ06887.1 iron-sulfur cluster insertion protein ErpA [Holospora obtusa F1]